MAYNKPLPEPDGDTKPFWNNCKEHKFTLQKCKECDHVRWPPSVICPQCHSRQIEWKEAEGSGKVYSYVVYHQPFHPAFKDDLPYVVAVVELKEGPHILTNITGCGHKEVKCDMTVELTWEDVTEEFSLPKFQPARNHSPHP